MLTACLPQPAKSQGVDDEPGPVSTRHSCGPVPRESIRTLSDSTSDAGVSMRFGLPWRVEGIRYEARETAEAAARRAGLPLNEWLNTIILQQAAGREPKLQPHAAAHGDDRTDDFSRMQLRLDDLARRIEHVAHTDPSAYAPKRNQYDTDQIADRVERLEQHIYEIASYRP